MVFFKIIMEEDEIASAFYERQRDALKQMPGKFKRDDYLLISHYVPYSLTGVENLRNLFKPFEIS